MAYNVAMPASPLDDAALYERIDPERLRDRIGGLPEQIEEAWAAASALELPASYREAERVVVLGMGGSGIGGSLLAALAAEAGSRTPVSVVRGYRVPGWVDGRALVVGSSSSGNTEEVLSAFACALDSGARCVAVASGGKLLALARERGVPALQARWDGEPRAALGWSYIGLLAICGRLGLLPDASASVREAAQALREQGATLGPDAPERANLAKELARDWSGKFVVVIGAEALAPVAYRWRTQINENAKSWAASDELPEMNHNAPLGYGAPAELLPLLRVVLLRHGAAHPRVRLRVEATAEELGGHGISARVVDVAGGDVLSQQLRGVQLGDWASYYLGVLSGVNPSSMDALERLKSLLASKE